MRQHRIDRLIEARNLEPVPADDAEVAAIWSAALREWADASVPGLSVAGAFIHVYQAAFRAASAAVRAAGYRQRGAVGGHHHVSFYALGALGDEDLERIADTMQGIRGGRHSALYGDEEELEPEDLEKARRTVSALLERVHRWLLDARPALKGGLAAPPSS
ncbi:HEPN domain-containing protein [Longimicrobium sp.]|uniref:HEPN domain-containing protein n=1 Tax=Longimicrobium sp. TaxID=2029185 RepID=UPI002BFC3F90|nr:HEPN domain-containing protein [Longimicrobium sp.]HSU13065.1 HEPN domain-containing protein [Longimicrobium sp.]